MNGNRIYTIILDLKKYYDSVHIYNIVVQFYVYYINYIYIIYIYIYINIHTVLINLFFTSKAHSSNYGNQSQVFRDIPWWTSKLFTLDPYINNILQEWNRCVVDANGLKWCASLFVDDII